LEPWSTLGCRNLVGTHLKPDEKRAVIWVNFDIGRTIQSPKPQRWNPTDFKTNGLVEKKGGTFDAEDPSN
jgi:hypothetical protein